MKLPSFNTIQELEAYIYQKGGYAQILGDNLMTEFPSNDLVKADAPVLRSTTGWLNVIYGRKTWLQLNQDISIFSILPKKPWDNSGFRVVTAYGKSSGGGVAEHAAIPETTKPTVGTVDVTPKMEVVNFDMSMMKDMVPGDDQLPWEDLKELNKFEHSKTMNADLLVDVDTLAGYNLESIDRVTSSYSEVTAGLCTAGDSDIYGLDRDAAASWADGQCSHASGVDRDLSLALVDALITACRPYWDKPNDLSNKVFVTGDDTLDRWASLMAAQYRYTSTNITVSVNGISRTGQNTGFEVATYKQIPIITAEVPKDTISRIYLLDLDHLDLRMWLTTVYLESPDVWSINKFGKEGAFVTGAELWCNRFKAQGKLRDLK